MKSELARSSSLPAHSHAGAFKLDAGGFAAQFGTREHSRRLGLWQIDPGAQCSVIGTCLSDRDLRDAVRKHVSLDERATNYDIHCHCAHASQTEGPLARTLTKMLNRRHAGAISLAGKANSESELIALWIRLRDSGQIAAGYWAVISHGGVSDCIKQRLFGEVHMLSHLQGRSTHQLAAKLAETQRRCNDLEARLKRTETGRQEALVERDEAVAERELFRTALAERQARVGGASVEHGAARTMARLRDELAQRERALVIARARARQAEARLESVETEQRQRRRRSSLPTDSHSRVPDRHVTQADLAGTRILYVGGRNTVVRHLHSIAATFTAELQHHDGGVEESMHRLVEMVERCDAVICPIDCVSHGACRLAKSSCQRLKKIFLPVQTASRASFERALVHLSSLQRTETVISA